MTHNRTHWIGCWKEHPDCAGRYTTMELHFNYLVKQPYTAFLGWKDTLSSTLHGRFLGYLLHSESEINDMLYGRLK